MYSNNPYAQAGWSSANPNSANLPLAPASTLGVLPSHIVPDSHGVLVLEFSPVHPSILYSSIIGPSRVPFMKLNTARVGAHDVTFIIKTDRPNEYFAAIEWSDRPVVRIAGLFNDTRISDFLPLSFDRKYRNMMTKHGVLHWYPEDNLKQISLVAPGAREPLVVITRNPNAIRLHLRSEALRLGLLELSIVVTAILQSNKRID